MKGFKVPAARCSPWPSPLSLWLHPAPIICLRKTNLKLSIYPSEIHFILLDSLISNATSNMVQRHFTAVKHKSYFIMLSNNYIVCLPVHSHEHVILKNSAVRDSSYRYWKEQTRRRALKWHRALFDSVCEADMYRDIWQHSKHYMPHIGRLCSSSSLLAIKSCAQIWPSLESIQICY